MTGKMKAYAMDLAEENYDKQTRWEFALNDAKHALNYLLKTKLTGYEAEINELKQLLEKI